MYVCMYVDSHKLLFESYVERFSPLWLQVPSGFDNCYCIISIEFLLELIFLL
jgi:hypothetical protein